MLSLTEFEENLYNIKNYKKALQHVKYEDSGQLLSKKGGIFGAHEENSFDSAVSLLQSNGYTVTIIKDIYPSNGAVGCWKRLYTISEQNTPATLMRNQNRLDSILHTEVPSGYNVNEVFQKDIYSARIWPDEDFAKRAKEAAVDAYEYEKKGLKKGFFQKGFRRWHGYTNKGGISYRISGYQEFINEKGTGKVETFWLSFIGK